MTDEDFLCLERLPMMIGSLLSIFPHTAEIKPLSIVLAFSSDRRRSQDSVPPQQVREAKLQYSSQ